MGKKHPYSRFHIETRMERDLVPWPDRFNVRVRRPGLASLLLRELFQTQDVEILLNRPCIYGVFSGPLGGFLPRTEYCVGCLRCTIEYPRIVQVSHNPKRKKLGDSYFNSQYIEAIIYESRMGSIPVKGAGYRGKFGGPGWDGMWTDMSEIVRPTRDGIHGRETISTQVDIGTKPAFLELDATGKIKEDQMDTFSIQIPIIFDSLSNPPGDSSKLYRCLSETAEETQTLAIIPITEVLNNNLKGGHVVPLLKPDDVHLLLALPFSPRLIELDGWSEESHTNIKRLYPKTQVCLRIPFESGERWFSYIEKGIHCFHFVANYHGEEITGSTGSKRFVLDMIRQVHLRLVRDQIRDQITLIGSGGMIAAEHIPKAIIAGLDLVAIDTPVLVAIQARVEGDWVDSNQVRVRLPKGFSSQWGKQRLLNLVGAWRDQLLEVLGAMGLREVRRLRGEIGRAMFQIDLEKDTFSEIEGYHG